MIGFVRGTLFDIKVDTIIVENSGIGYEIYCSQRDISELMSCKGDEVLIYTFLQHKEDVMTLFGFISEKTKRGFLSLIKVDGIGPKLALKILSFYDVDKLFETIDSEDLDMLKKIPGVGPKMAGKIIFDLKGKLPSRENGSSSGIENDLVNALISLGYQESDVRNMMKKMKPLSEDFESEFKKLLKLMSGK